VFNASSFIWIPPNLSIDFSFHLASSSSSISLVSLQQHCQIETGIPSAWFVVYSSFDSWLLISAYFDSNRFFFACLSVIRVPRRLESPASLAYINSSRFKRAFSSW
jgi:hypothetical protein